MSVRDLAHTLTHIKIDIVKMLRLKIKEITNLSFFFR